VLKLNHNGSKLIFSTYIGGDSQDEGNDLILDDESNIYLTGLTASENFYISEDAINKTLNGNYDIFVLKLNQTGKTIDFSTYYGGRWGDNARSIFIDSNDDIILAGFTNSRDFPVNPEAFDTTLNSTMSAGDGFVLKFNHNASKLIFATFIGGTQGEECIDIVVDEFSNIIVSGNTGSLDFPLTDNAFDKNLIGREMFTIILDPYGSKLKYSTLIGGSNHEYCHRMVIDNNNSIYLTGYTYSTDFYNTSGAFSQNFSGDKEVL